jgi:hypothetical protein
MTTQDHQTLSDSYDESQAPVAAAPQVSEPAAPAAPADPSIASAEPSPPVTREPSGAAAPGDENPPVAAEPSTVDRESSTEEMLFADDELADLRARWAGVQAAFVDDPKDCVQKADVLVSDLVEQLTNGFSHARSRLEEQWARGQEASTEDLRVALMHYREFFERLLAV